MKRRPLRAVGGFGLSAICICLSTIILQVLTRPSPISFSSFFASSNSVDSFLWNRMTSTSEPPVDFQLHNLSVQRVRYVVEDVTTTKEKDQPLSTTSIAGVNKILSDFLTIPTSRRHAAQVSGVVVTWEDHPLATHARAKNARLEIEKKNDEVGKSDNAAVNSMSESYTYEVQIWVTGWGLDGFWNAANRKVTSCDPFLVLTDLPLEREMGFRVRMKAKQTNKSVLRLILPAGLFSTETHGEWSEVVTLSPTRDEELEAIVTSLADNQLLVLLLAVCIGSGFLVVGQLYVRPVLTVTRKQKLFTMQMSRRLPSAKEVAAKEASHAAAIDNTDKSMQELEHEIHDLRQELADLEDEVRQLMLLSGCGIETLSPLELEQLERELKYTLKRIQYLKQHGSPPPDMSNSTKGQLSVNGSSRGEKRRLKQRDDPSLSPIYEHRSF